MEWCSALRRELDALVFDLFAVPDHHRAKVLHFLAKRTPKLYAVEGVARSSGTQGEASRVEASRSLEPVRERLLSASWSPSTEYGYPARSDFLPTPRVSGTGALDP
jgi:hypothetical protein